MIVIFRRLSLELSRDLFHAEVTSFAVTVRMIRFV
jgi:hypothetical protein